MATDLRCRSCGALIAADAAWCGQCFAPVAEAEPEPEVVQPPEPTPVAPPPPDSTSGQPATGDALPEAPSSAVWPCGVCGGRNPIDVEACLTCGTPFAALMREGPEHRQVDPRDAVRRSLLFPGLGHRLVGRPMDGFARGALFSVSLLMAILLAATGFTSTIAVVAFAGFVLSAVGTYVVSAVEAERLARGGEVMIGARVLMWVVAGEVFVGVMVLAFSVVSASRR
jgi:ribosomal protein L40E